MKKEHTVNLQCSFCGKHQREVKKLVAGPNVYICDECIGLCSDIVADEFERHAGKEPETVRLKIGRLLQDEARATAGLRATVGPPADVPESVRSSTRSLVAASEALQRSVQRWSLPPEEAAAMPDAPAWLDPALSRLTETEELVQGLRHALERSLTPERMLSFDRLQGHLSGVRKSLLLNARNEEAGRRAAPGDQTPVD
jgi:hypothetical protein